MGGADTIFALSSGAPPAAIAVMRVSGPEAASALKALAGKLPTPRQATLRWLRDPDDGGLLDRALLLWFPGPHTATGEDLAELHLHGGRSVVAAVSAALGRLPGLRPAQAGEFTRRAFENGRIDLAEAEGLADLLSAETDAQRRNALALASGELSRAVEQWRRALLALWARVEAELDFSDEDDVPTEGGGYKQELLDIAGEIERWLARPSAERLREGIRVVLAGPPNAGKSTLLNALVGRDAAITSAIPGTTRDIIEAPVAIGGTAFVFSDTAGLRDSSDDIERAGVERARVALSNADIILWLGHAEACPDADRSIMVHAKADLEGRGQMPKGSDVAVSARDGTGLTALVDLLRIQAANLLPATGEVALNRRQRTLLAECAAALHLLDGAEELLLVAESTRLALRSLDQLTGQAGVDNMLDALFGTFCIGK